MIRPCLAFAVARVPVTYAEARGTEDLVQVREFLFHGGMIVGCPITVERWRTELLVPVPQQVTR